MFQDLSVLSTLYQLIFEGSACNISIEGGALSADEAQDFNLDASDTNINDFAMSGTQVSKLSGATFITGQSVTNNIFDSCKQITPGASTFTGNTISKTVDTVGAVLLPTSQTNFKENNYLDNTTGPAIEVPSGFGTTSTCDGDYFDGNTYDYNNLTGATHTVSAVNQANPGTYTGTLVVFSNAVLISVTVFDKDTGLELQYARVMLLKESDHSTEVLKDETDSNGLCSDTYSYAGDVDVVGWVRQWDLSGDDYTPQDISGTITSTGLSLAVNLEPI